jgi:hypothetical protein
MVGPFLRKPGFQMRSIALDWIGRNYLRQPVHRLVAPYLGRGHSSRSGQRVRIYYARNKISFSQVFPFLFYGDALRRHHGIDIRIEPVEPLLSGATRPPSDADTIIFQTWFTVDHDQLYATLERIRAASLKTRIVFFDSFAHNDLRLAKVLDPYISIYVKKSLFRDRELYFLPVRGDTNLTEYYNDLYGIEAAPVDWQVPRGILPKLRTGPGFFTGPGLIRGFSSNGPPPAQGRDIDVHARLGAKGDGWYGQMRRDSLAKLHAIPGLTVASQGSVKWAAYMDELRRSKFCFSPFGFGELCWRDIEAFMTGAVLIKPDMSHLETQPDLFEPWVTYVPVKWDFSDLEEVLLGLVQEPDQLAKISRAAYDRVASFLSEDGFSKWLSTVT